MIPISWSSDRPATPAPSSPVTAPTTAASSGPGAIASDAPPCANPGRDTCSARQGHEQALPGRALPAVLQTVLPGHRQRPAVRLAGVAWQGGERIPGHEPPSDRRLL